MAIAIGSATSARVRKLRQVAMIAAVAMASNWLPATSGIADDGLLTWIVKSITSGDETEAINISTLRAPQEGSALVTGQRISTGANEQIVLVNGRDIVTVAPNSTVMIGDNDSATTMRNLDLRSGAIHVEVGTRRMGQTFAVETPYLIATVKGTKFDVVADRDGASVTVTEGLVGVTSNLSGATVDISIGKTAVVKRGMTSAPAVGPTPISPAEIGAEASIDAPTSNPVSDAAGTINNTVGGLTDSASGAVGGAVGGASGSAGDAVGDAAGAVGGAVGGATGAVGGAVGGVGGAVGGAVGGIGGALGGGLGGGLK